MLYRLLRPLLFTLDAELAHSLTLKALRLLQPFGLSDNRVVPCEPKTIMGLKFPNPVGLAAGLDKNGDYIDVLAKLGFGFIEVGTVTPRPQPGNPKPRLFRIPEAHAIINRMGFNNLGVDYLLENIKRTPYHGILGINIGKNFDTPVESAIEDYLLCFRKVYAVASYVTINISSPNTLNLRQLQNEHALDHLVATLKLEQSKLSDQQGRYTPLLVKIAPDLDESQLESIAAILMKHNIDGVIATNTTISRPNIAGLSHADETGGLSGSPVREASTRVISKLYSLLGEQIPIIGVGGIVSANDAKEKIAAGASLIQLYTGLIYAGPDLVNQCISTLCHSQHVE